MCIECLGWEEVLECDGWMLDGSICPLVDFWNMQGKQNPKERNEAIRKFCLECMCGSSFEVTNCKSFYCPLHPYRQTITDKTTLFNFDMPDLTILDVGYSRLPR